MIDENNLLEAGQLPSSEQDLAQAILITPSDITLNGDFQSIDEHNFNSTSAKCSGKCESGVCIPD